MALINCPECGKEVSNKATTCPNCGVTLSTPQYAKKKKSKLPIIIILIFIGLLGIMANKIAPSKESTTSSTENSDTSSNTSSKEENIPLGTAASIGDFSITANGITEANEIAAGNGFLKYTPDSGKYAIVNVTLKNTSQSSSSFTLSSFSLIASDGAKYSPTIIAAADENYLSIESINPNVDVTGNLAFNIPTDADITTFTLKYNGGFSGTSTFDLQ